MFNPAYIHPSQTSENFRSTYEAGVGDVIALDVAVIVGSGNIGVSPSFSPTSNGD